MDIYQILRIRKNADKDEMQIKYSRMLDSYQLTAAFAEDQEIADIARIKLEQLIAAGKECDLNDEHIESDESIPPQTDISSIKLALNSSKSDVNKLKEYNILGKIDTLPENAEKHYLKAVVYLRIDSSFQGCQKAVTELHNAIKLDTSNEAYTGLLDAISEQIKDYEQRQHDKFVQDEKIIKERQMRSQQVLAEAQRRQFWDSTGSCFAGLASLFSAISVCWCCWKYCCSGCF